MPGLAICDKMNSMETKKTLLEQAAIAANNGNFEEWLNTLSDDDKAQFKLEFHNAIISFGEAINRYNEFLLELPNIIANMTEMLGNGLTKTALLVCKAIADNQNER